jgi:hypothetical protein
MFLKLVWHVNFVSVGYDFYYSSPSTSIVLNLFEGPFCILFLTVLSLRWYFTINSGLRESQFPWFCQVRCHDGFKIRIETR